MLNAEERHYFTDLLSPPAGFRLEKAVGTTYSLELPALLLAPLSMRQRPVEGVEQFRENSSRSEEAEQRPISLVEAIRHISERLALFCQRGRVKVPDSYSSLYASLESSIAEVDPKDGTFHPKLWILHFEADTESHYRLVSTSRNLSYNQTWDTVIALEGRRTVDSGASADPLVRFLHHLLDKEVSARGQFDRQGLLTQFAKDLRDVTFRVPSPFEEATLRLQGWEEDPLLGSQPTGERAVFISPFLKADPLKKMQARCASSELNEPAVLVSRKPSIDDLREASLCDSGSKEDPWENIECHVVSTPRTSDPGEDGSNLVGLHAKVYVTERGEQAFWRFTSANLTHRGLEGKNVEFAVDLVGPTRQAGIDHLLQPSESDDNLSLRELLVPYSPPDELPDMEEIEAERKAERKAEAWRSFFSAGGLTLSARPTGEPREYDVQLRFVPTTTPPGKSISEVQIWLSSLDQNPDARRFKTDKLKGEISKDLGTISAINLTPFVAFHLEAEEPVSHTVQFVLGGEIEGLKEDRRELALEHFIHNRSRFLRYLRYLLDDEDDYWIRRTEREEGRATDAAGGRGNPKAELPLMEDLVRKGTADEHKIKDVHSLLQSVQKLDDADTIIPSSFLEDVWLPLLRAVKPELTDEY